MREGRVLARRDVLGLHKFLTLHPIPCVAPGHAPNDGPGADQQQGPQHEPHPVPLLRVASMLGVLAGALR